MRLKEQDSEGLTPRSSVARTVCETRVDGRDEMNLVEFPLTGVSDRFLDGRKTIVLADQVWDRDRKAMVDRELAISGSDRYGLPTAKDEDVLLACIQLSAAHDFRHRQQKFSRYELLKMLGLPDEGKNYARLAMSLRRWKGVTIYSNRAFYDHGRGSWVNRDFGIFDNLTIYEKDGTSPGQSAAVSSFVWNDVLFDSFQAGFVKKLDWGLYCRLTDPVAKRLYRLLDKRFYHGDRVEFDLHDLAINKIRLSERYNTAQIKRALTNGIAELERCWALRAVPREQRFIKQAPGQWQVVFQRRRQQSPRKSVERLTIAADGLEKELVRRGIGPATANELVEQQPAETVRTMIDLFDWYQQKGQEKGPGFLVDSIRRSSEYRLPRGFGARGTTGGQPLASRVVRRAAKRTRQTTDNGLKLHTSPCRDGGASTPFEKFWAGLGPDSRRQFESEAVSRGEPTKRDGYRRLETTGGPGFEQYRQILLRDHFARLQSDRADT